MEKTTTLLLLLFLSVSCGKSGGGSSSGDQSALAFVGSDSPEQINQVLIKPTPVSGVPQEALSFKTNVDYLSGFSQSDEDKYDSAVAIVKKVVATEAFRTKVFNHIYNGTKSFANNNGLSNAKIYQSILDAAEKLTPAKNNTLDVGVKLYYENNSVVGYTTPSITYFNVNTKFFDQYDPNEVAGNLFHEWLHKLGYGHDSTATTRRPYSVPYAIGYMIRDIGKNFL